MISNRKGRQLQSRNKTTATNKTKELFMRMHKNVYLALAILFLLSFIDSLFDTEKTQKIFFWEVNIWVYRLFRMAIAVLFMKSYLDIRNAEKSIEK